MYCKAIISLLLALLLQILLGSITVESGIITPGVEGFTKEDLDQQEDVVHHIFNVPKIRQQLCDADPVLICKFVHCCLNDGRGDAYARSIAEDCSLEMAVFAVMHNTTLQKESCSKHGPEYPDCIFVTCVLKDPRGEALAKDVGKDCYRYSYNTEYGPATHGSASVTPSSGSVSLSPSGSRALSSPGTGSAATAIQPSAVVLGTVNLIVYMLSARNNKAC